MENFDFLESIKLPIFSSKIDNNVLFFEPKSKSSFEIIGANLDDSIDIINDKFHRYLQSSVLEIIDKMSNDIIDFDIVFVYEDGKRRWFNIRGKRVDSYIWNCVFIETTNLVVSNKVRNISTYPALDLEILLIHCLME